MACRRMCWTSSNSRDRQSELRLNRADRRPRAYRAPHSLNLWLRLPPSSPTCRTRPSSMRTWCNGYHFAERRPERRMENCSPDTGSAEISRRARRSAKALLGKIGSGSGLLRPFHRNPPGL
jgi:hypothetical protein